MSSDSNGKGHPLEENPNWKGGRTISSHGYVLLKRPDHPAADVRGYVYEHRLVAEEKIGRPLKEDEQVHHKNGDKQDNDPDNLEVLTIAEHRAKHRESSNRQDPHEPNPTVECACGCGETFSKYDDSGRPREYVSGHNPTHSGDEEYRSTSEVVLDVLADGPMARQEVIGAVDRQPGTVEKALTALKCKGDVENPIYGMWALPEHAGDLTDWRDENEEISCACGCGEKLQRFDNEGRERRYITGHNSDSEVRDGVLRELKDGPMKRSELADTLSKSPNSVSTALKRLKEREEVEKAEGWGMWRLNNEEETEGVDA